MNPAPDYGRATALSAEVTGEHEVWTPVDDRCVDDRVQPMLSDGLTISDAVKIALFENRTLRARMLDIGIAKADLVQAGLWSNPTASFSIRFPTDGGTRTIDASLLQSIAEFWQVPVRRCAAARGLEKTTLTVAHEIATLVGTVRRNFARVVEAEKKLGLARDARRLVDELVGLTGERVRIGTGTALDLNATRSELAESDVDLFLAQTSVLETRAALAESMGLRFLADDVQVVDGSPAVESRVPPAEQIVALALDARLDARAAKVAIAVAAANLRKECGQSWRVVEAGADSETVDALAIGPAMNLEIPIFDQNQAQIAKAKITLAQERQRYEGIRRSVELQVRTALRRLERAQEADRLFQGRVITEREEALRLARESFSVGKAPLFVVLDAQRRLVAARRGSAEAATAAFTAMLDLEAAAARPIDEIAGSLPSDTRPSESRPAKEDAR